MSMPVTMTRLDLVSCTNTNTWPYGLQLLT